MQLSNHHANGKPGETTGKSLLVSVPKQTWESIEEAVVRNEDLVDERQVLTIFGITKKTLCNDVCSGKIPKCDYTIAFNKKRFFFLKKLFGLVK